MSEKDFVNKYLKDFSSLTMPNEEIVSKIITSRDIITNAKQNKKKVMIFGNGGSAAIASHFSVDLTKNARVRCTNYNESDLLTCFSNDYGYERWVEKAIDFYGDEGDSLILISAGGNSQNMINGANQARKKKIEKKSRKIKITTATAAPAPIFETAKACS